MPPVIEAEKRYSRKALRQLRRALSTISPSVAYHVEGIARDLSMAPAELEQFVELHIKAWEATAGVKDATIEDIVIELRTKLLEDRKALAELLLLGQISPKDLRDVGFDVAEQADQARQVVAERADVDLTGTAAAKKAKDGSFEHFWCRSIIYTPSGTIRVGGRILEKSNATLRKYHERVDTHQESDYFLRVAFRDEDETMLLPSSGAPQDKLLQRSVAKALKDGISFAGRKYEFLAYSQSGLRDRTVWFVAPWQDEDKAFTINAAAIRKRFGLFGKISHQPAKLGARYSQGFTSSHATYTLHYGQIGAIPDIVEKDEAGVETTNHTDGAGTMSLEVRDRVWQALQKSGIRRDLDGAPPTVVQFRLGGSKGVLAVDNRLQGAQVKLRPSQDKFKGLPDDDDGESFCLNVSDAFTRPGLLRLNRPLVSALDDLGISTETFIRYQNLAVDSLAPEDLETLQGAHNVLHRFVFGGATRFKSLVGSLTSLSSFVGGILHEEPFLRGALEVIRTRSLRDLKERARIPIPNSYVLVGVPDEDQALKADQIYACLRFPDKPDEAVYLEGRILVTRSPSVDPGDLRILNAVGKLPAHLEGKLRMAELENCIVLPTVGERALASMMGGGDLDGDTYQVITLPDLIPQRVAEPRLHAGPPPLELDRPATIYDVADCFLNYLTNDTTGIIATTHLIVADRSPQHGFDPVCQQLADLHSTSVDAPKTGSVVPLDSIPKLKTKVRPDFFRKRDEFEPAFKEGPQYYDSQRALGHLYRNIEETGLRTPTCVLTPALGDGQSTSFRVLELQVERDIASLFDASPHILKSIVDSHRPMVASVLNAFYAALHDLAIVHSLPRTDGRLLSEFEIFATASLQEVQRGEGARGNAVSAMRRQTAHLVDWLEAQLTGPAVESQHTDVESLKLRYSAWRVAVEDGDEYDFGVKTAPWTCLALVFEAMQNEGKCHSAGQCSTRPASLSAPLARASASATPRRTLSPNQSNRRQYVDSFDNSVGLSSNSSRPLIPYSTHPKLSTSTPPTSPAHSLAVPGPTAVTSATPADPWARELDSRKAQTQNVATNDTTSGLNSPSSEEDDQGLREILASIAPSTRGSQRQPAHDDADSLASSSDSDGSLELDEAAAKRFHRQLEQEEIEADEAEARKLLYQQLRRRQYLEGKHLPSKMEDPIAYRKHRDDFMADNRGRADFQAAGKRQSSEGIVDYFEQLAQEQRRRETHEFVPSKDAGGLTSSALSPEDWPPLKKASVIQATHAPSRLALTSKRPPLPPPPYSPTTFAPYPTAVSSDSPLRHGVDYSFPNCIPPSPPRPPPQFLNQWTEIESINKSHAPAKAMDSIRVKREQWDAEKRARIRR
ncbi:RNA-directed RNA polymerase [Rhodotorula toruloides]|uniref:RNA-dependent RNA polymerase n=1 Tax=Rhodotorula toruloides TaxID=5286 RepID=A0A511KJL2_RHOTO|nr:RNA-directed RNA polymerase [Rhodotorula toruloides]